MVTKYARVGKKVRSHFKLLFKRKGVIIDMNYSFKEKGH